MIVENVVAQHIEEAGFAWLQRDAAVRQAHYDLEELAGLDQRLDAHIDGLRVAGNAAWEACAAQLNSTENSGEIFATSVLAFESAIAVRVQAVLDGVTAAPLIRALISALGWVSHGCVSDQLQRLLRTEDPMLRRIGIAGFAIHCQDPGVPLVHALSDDDPLLRARALGALGELGRRDLLKVFRAQLADSDDACRFAAASSAVILGQRASVAVLRSFERSPHWGEKAIKLGMRASDHPTARQWQRDLAAAPETSRLSVIAAGHLGDPALVPWLMEQMEAPEHRRVAGEAFTFITGVDITHKNMDAKQPEGFASGPNDDPADENVAIDADDDLPWPNPAAIGAWWARNRNEFRFGTRYLLGKPIVPEWMVEVLRIGRQRHRASAAVELSLANPGRPLFNTCAPGFRQKQMLRARRV